MLTPEQIAHFETFGFLLLRQTFSTQEMEKITRDAEKLWEEYRQREVVGEHDIHMNFFAETSPVLTALVDDDRIFKPVEQLLGPNFIWVGSEGNITKRASHRWYSDRKCWRKEEQEEVTYRRLKIMFYLDPVTKDTGCLRVIPGSHQMPFHQELGAQEADHQSEPGDVVLFNHSLFHSVYGGWDGRRILAFKFTAQPTTDRDLNALNNTASKYYVRSNVFRPHENFLNSDRPRIRGMVKGLVELGANL
jgi:ectoine hydroxylase-related dioxygenase (phytanoyl-CoA dioxygenase family)